jgi:DNA-binding MarR family transcriptional regulator
MAATTATKTATTPKSEAMETLAHSFKAAMAAVRRVRGRDTHNPGALSHAQYQVLFELLRQREMPAGALAAQTGVSAASMTQMLDRLADAGLVERAATTNDRRVVTARLTKNGRKTCERRRAELEPLWNEKLEDFSPAELRTAAAVLDQLTGLYEHLARSAGAD